MEDQGLGVEWEGLQGLMSHSANVSFSPFLGTPIVVDGEVFDPVSYTHLTLPTTPYV